MSLIRTAVALPLLAILVACTQVGSEDVSASPGIDVANNANVQLAAYGGDRVLLAAAQEFRRSVNNTVNFAFNSSVLDTTARAILDQQAVWILGHPSLRLRIYGHTDLVGSAAYNYQLGQRRADAVARYLVSLGINPGRLEAVVSLGLTRPLIPTEAPELLNRRTVTEVVGYAAPSASFDFDGKVAHRVYEAYVRGERPVLGGEAYQMEEVSVGE